MEQGDLFVVLDTKHKRLQVLEGQITRLEKMKSNISCWSNLWLIFDKKIKALQIDCAYLDREIQQYVNSLN